MQALLREGYREQLLGQAATQGSAGASHAESALGVSHAVEKEREAGGALPKLRDCEAKLGVQLEEQHQAFGGLVAALGEFQAAVAGLEAALQGEDGAGDRPVYTRYNLCHIWQLAISMAASDADVLQLADVVKELSDEMGQERQHARTTVVQVRVCVDLSWSC